MLAGGTAYAATEYPIEGGQWNYGFEWGWATSDYYNESVCHGASVYNDWGNDRSVDTAPGYWAESAIQATPWTGNQYYYRTC